MSGDEIKKINKGGAMSDMKCPFCEQWLTPCIQNQNDWIYHCDNPKCPIYDDADIENAKHPLATEELWQELIRTRKALDVAVDALDVISQITNQIDVCDTANDALNTITSLKQKDK